MVFAVGNRSRNSRDACKGARGWGSPGGIMVSVVCCGVFECTTERPAQVGACTAPEFATSTAAHDGRGV